MNYKLLFVGKKLYPEKIFIAEAQKYGVNRALPLRIIKGLKWNDKILLAAFKPKPIGDSYTIINIDSKLYWNNSTGWQNLKSATLFTEEDKEYMNLPADGEWIKAENIDGRKNRKNGKANVFGYFTVTGLNYTASDEFKKQLASKLDIISTSNANLKVQRQCGNYSIGISYVVKNTIQEIIERATTLAQERVEQVKFFVAGYFTSLELTLEPVNFTRVLQNIELDLNITQKNGVKEFSLGYIYDYEKRLYIKKYNKRGRPSIK